MIKKLLLILSLFAGLSGPALAGSYSAPTPDGKGRVTLFDDKPCLLSNRPDARAAEVIWEGKRLEACWIQADKDHVFIGDETGDSGFAPLSMFKEDKKI